MIKKITTEELRCMKDSEGLILQGCGGDLHEWVDGINNLLTEAGILLNDTKFKSENCMAFGRDGLTCLLFPFTNDVKLQMGGLAMWRLATHGNFGGTWLSDYVHNQLGGFVEEQRKPDCPLIGENGNIFHLLGIAARTLRENGMDEQASEMMQRASTSGSYDKALYIIGEYVNITSAEDGEITQEFGGM